MDADPAMTAAVAIGGTLACISAAEAYGLWTPRSGIHVQLARNTSRLRRHPVTWVPHWVAPAGRPTRPVVKLTEALRQVADCQPLDYTVAVWDSALHQRRITLRELRAMATTRRARRALRRCDPRAESGIESIVRVRLVELGYSPRVQVPLAPDIRVDLLLRRVVIEVDGSAYHSGPAEFERDRERDAVLNAWGYRVLHFSYRQVMEDWPSVLSTIVMVLRQHG